MSVQNLPLYNRNLMPTSLTLLEEVSSERPWAYLGVARSQHAKAALFSNFQGTVGDFHDKTTTATMYAFSEFRVQERPISNLKLHLLSAHFHAKKKFVQFLQGKENNYVAALAIATIVSAFALFIFKSVAQQVFADQQPRPFMKSMNRLIEGYTSIALPVSKISSLYWQFKTLIGLSPLRKITFNNITTDEFIAPSDVFLRLEIKPITLRKKDDLENERMEETRALKDMLDMDEISDEALNSPRIVLIGKQATSIKTACRLFFSNKAARLPFRGILHNELPGSEQEEKFISHLQTFFCISSRDDFLKCTGKDSFQERVQALKNITPAILHKYIE